MQPSGSSRQRVSALQARFGEHQARARVAKARELRAEKQRKEAEEAEQKAAREAAELAAAEAQRQRAARRAASERRARKEAERQDEERLAQEQWRRESDRAAGQQYANSAAQRAESERLRREELAQEVLFDLVVLQSQRRKVAEEKGRELQRRCEVADWAHCRPVVDRAWKQRPPPRGPGPEPVVRPPAYPGAGATPGPLPKLTPPSNSSGVRQAKSQPPPVGEVRLPRLVVA